MIKPPSTQPPINEQPRFKKSVDTETLENFLRDKPAGEIIPYSTLNELIGRDVRGKGAACLASARRRLWRESVFYATVQGNGIQRVEDSDAIGEVESGHRDRMTRLARRGLAKLCAVRYERLSDDDKARQNTLATVFALTVAADNKRPLIEQKVKSQGEPLPVGDLARLIG